MTIDYRPNDEETTALPKKTAHIPFVDMGHIFTAHVPVIDLPEEIMLNVPEAEKWRGRDVHLQHQMVILCLN